MWSKSFIATLTLVAGLVSQVQAHAGVSPALGIKGTLTRDNVDRPSDGKACGKADIAKGIDSSTAVAAAADGTFTVTGINFNGGDDGSTFFTLEIDATGTGSTFVAGTISKNGDKAPTANTAQVQITASLPAGTKCAGGAGKNACLASFKSSAGFGNCVVVTQGATKRANVGASRLARAARAAEPVARAVEPVARAAVDFGNCGTPAIAFGPGNDGRKEDSFVPATKDFSHGSALNAKVITGFICSQLASSCKANQAAVDTCNTAATAANDLKGQAAADKFNSILSSASARRVVRAAADFGNCGTPAIAFGPGNDGRKEDSFVPATKDFNHGSALNPKVITGFICSQLASSCKANQAAVDSCNTAAAAANDLKGQAAADKFNSILASA